MQVTLHFVCDNGVLVLSKQRHREPSGLSQPNRQMANTCSALQYRVVGKVVPQELGDILVMKRLAAAEGQSTCFKMKVFRAVEATRYQRTLRSFHDDGSPIWKRARVLLCGGVLHERCLQVEIAVVRLVRILIQW